MKYVDKRGQEQERRRKQNFWLEDEHSHADWGTVQGCMTGAVVQYVRDHNPFGKRKEKRRELYDFRSSMSVVRGVGGDGSGKKK